MSVFVAPLLLSAGLGALLAACRGEAPPPPAAPDSGLLAAKTSTAVATASVAAAPAAAPVRPGLPPELVKEGFGYVDARISSHLEAAIIAGTDPEVGRALAQVVNRALVWWVTPHTDLRPGDRIEVVYKLRPPEEPVVHAVWFNSQKHARRYEAVRFQARGSKYGRWFQADGTELEKRLVDAPIADYEQITSLINDGRRHKGVDFKCAMGTDIVAPWDGKVERTTWSFRSNGNCVDLHDPKTGLNAYFLHLSEIDPAIKPGATVKKGQVIGKSGNTGHSFAPHLHYQIMRGEKAVQDPFKVHATTQAKAPADEIPLIQAELARLAKMRTAPDAPGNL